MQERSLESSAAAQKQSEEKAARREERAKRKRLAAETEAAAAEERAAAAEEEAAIALHANRMAEQASTADAARSKSLGLQLRRNTYHCSSGS